MNRASLRLVLFVAIFLSSCASRDGLAPGEAITLQVGEEVRVDGCDLRVRFDGIESDSRCPQGVTCVWEGDAVILLTLTGGGDPDPRAVRLHTNASGGTEHGGECTVRLLRLQPEAIEGVVPPQDTYRVTLTVGGEA